MDKELVSLIAPNKYQDIWCKFVKNLSRYSAGMPYQIIKVDGDVEDFRYSRAMNEGLKLADTKYVCMMNDDIYPKIDNWLEALIEGLEKWRYAMVGPCMISTEKFDPIFFKYKHAGKSYVISKDAPNPFTDGQRSLSGGCMVGKTKQIKYIGGWDENFEHYWEDTDLCFRMEAELKNPNGIIAASVVHHPDQATSSRIKEKIGERIDRSREYFTKKWGTKYLKFNDHAL